jgi:hypothetical protein
VPVKEDSGSGTADPFPDRPEPRQCTAESGPGRADPRLGRLEPAPVRAEHGRCMAQPGPGSAGPGTGRVCVKQSFGLAETGPARLLAWEILGRAEPLPVTRALCPGRVVLGMGRAWAGHSLRRAGQSLDRVESGQGIEWARLGLGRTQAGLGRPWFVQRRDWAGRA